MIEQILGVSIYLGIALALAVVCTFGLGLMLQAGTRIRNEPLPLVFFAILAAGMVTPIAAGRLITDGLATSEASFSDIGSSFWITRIITLGVLILCIERCLRFVFRREWASTHSWGLFWAFVVFGLSNQILNGIFGSHPSFDHKALYAFPIYFSFFLVAQSQPERCFRFARLALLLFFVCSAITAVAMPQIVIEKGYTSGLPGLTFRYYGLATHANTLGPLAVALMICLWRFPFNSRWLNLSSWLLVSTSLVLSQSKTTLIVATVFGLFLIFYRYRTRLMQTFPGGRSGLGMGLIACVCFCLSSAILATWFGTDSVDRLINQVDYATGGKLTSLTGRTNIWFIAWQEFLASPLFGYGPSIWSPSYSLSVGFSTATNAHNQLLQSLSSAGLIGATGLIFYASMLVIYALRAAPRSDGISVALVGFMLFRSFAEAPFVSKYSIGIEFFVHLLALVACIGFLPAKQVEQALKTFESDVPRPSGGRYSDWNAARKAVP